MSAKIMFSLLVILFVIKLYTRTDFLNISLHFFWRIWLPFDSEFGPNIANMVILKDMAGLCCWLCTWFPTITAEKFHESVFFYIFWWFSPILPLNFAQMLLRFFLIEWCKYYIQCAEDLPLWILSLCVPNKMLKYYRKT